MEGDCAIPVPRLGGNTRRGVTIVLPNARSHPTLLGGGAAREAVPNAQLETGVGAGRTPWAHKLKGVSAGAAQGRTKLERHGKNPVFLNTPPYLHR